MVRYSGQRAAIVLKLLRFLLPGGLALLTSVMAAEPTQQLTPNQVIAMIARDTTQKLPK